jgi:hypothetical protein
MFVALSFLSGEALFDSFERSGRLISQERHFVLTAVSLNRSAVSLLHATREKKSDHSTKRLIGAHDQGVVYEARDPVRRGAIRRPAAGSLHAGVHSKEGVLI